MSIMDEWIEKVWYIHIYTGICTTHGIYIIYVYSAVKINEIMPSGATEIIILRELSQTEKDKYYMISLICEI